MHYVFQKDFRVYFLLDFVRGGHLYQYLQAERRFMEDRVCFYAAQIVLALGYLHKSGIVYRDLKTENILVEEDGYLKLADFGRAKM